MLKEGIEGRAETEVVYELTAAHYGSGLLEVFATPAMIALMEKTALDSVAPYLDEGCGTVGTRVEVSHISATPIGMKVYCSTRLIRIDRRRLVFEVEAYDEAGKIGEGIHERFIVNNDPFMEKTLKKLEAGG